MSAKKMAARRPWDNLPTPLWQIIFHGLDRIIDRVRFMAVCRSFRSMVIQFEPKRYIISSPLLLLPPPISYDSPIREFYNFSDSKIYKSFIPELQGKWCCGSSFGWLFTVHFGSEDIILINPMTGSQINLPPLSRFSDPPELDIPEFPRNNVWFIYRTAISSSPSRSQDFIVMAMITDLKILAFCKPGIDGEWFNLPLIHGPAEDFRFFRGKFYVLTNWGAVITWDLRDTLQPISTTIILPEYKALYIPSRRYLVENVDGFLFKVCKYYEFDQDEVVEEEETEDEEEEEEYGNDDDANDDDDDDEEEVSEEEQAGDEEEEEEEEEEAWGEEEDVVEELDYFNATVFSVSKLDEERNEWIHEVMWGHAVFLGCNSSIGVSLNNNPEFEKNGIYFTDDNAGRCPEEDPNGCNVVGCYNQLRGEVSEVYKEHPFWTSPCIWLTPSL